MTAALFFDFLSPYSYFAWMQLGERRRELELVPVVFGAILGAHGTLGPAEIPAKRRFVIRDCLRMADRLGVPFTFPANHPFRSIDALRLSLRDIAGDRQVEVIDALWRAGWQQGRDLADEAVLAGAMDELGLDGTAMMAATRRDQAKQQLRANTERALALGAFGVPTFYIHGQLVWGSDRIDDVLALLAGERTVDETRAAELEATPLAVVRRAGAPARDLEQAEARARDIFGRARFMTALGVELASVTPGVMQTTLVVRDDHQQQDGFVHAGVIATMADHTAGGAAVSVMPPGKVPLTIEYKINLLRPAVGPSLRCHARVLKPGRTVTVVDAEVYNVGDSGEKLVAKATVTLAVVDRPDRPRTS